MQNLTKQLLLSLGAHILALSIVAIEFPRGLDKLASYPKINFWGPILNKAAFDVMIEKRVAPIKAEYPDMGHIAAGEYFKLKMPRKELTMYEPLQNLKSDAESLIIAFLRDPKIVPEVIVRAPKMESQ